MNCAGGARQPRWLPFPCQSDQNVAVWSLDEGIGHRPARETGLHPPPRRSQLLDTDVTHAAEAATSASRTAFALPSAKSRRFTPRADPGLAASESASRSPRKLRCTAR